MIVDTSALLALFNQREPEHRRVTAAVRAAAPEGLVVSPYVLAELDYLITTRVGVAAELAVLGELTGGAWDLAGMAEADVAGCATVIEKYADQAIGLADASLVVLARRYSTRCIATLDRRHFEVIRPLDGGRFRLLP